jgi:adenosylhomocysteine nucleosidase
MDRPIFILGALREEINQIKKLMIVKERLKMGKADVWSGRWKDASIILIRTGMGKESALGALKEVSSRTVPSLILSVGYAGGLDLKLKVGDLVIADKVLEIDQTNSFSKSYFLDPEKLGLFNILDGQKKITLYRGTLITVTTVIAGSSIKKELGKCHKALAVDMETSALVNYAIENKIPFASVRAISDTMEQSLINISSLVDNNGNVSKIKAGWYAVTHPNEIKSFISLRSQSQRATTNLTKALGVILKTL